MWVQNVDYCGEGAAKPFQKGLHRLFGEFAAAGRQVNRVLGCGAGGTAAANIIGRQPGA